LDLVKKKEETTPQEETPEINHSKKEHHHGSHKDKKKEEPKKKSKDTGSINAYIVPAITKLSSETKDPNVIQALEQLKKAITEVEVSKPGITHKLIQRIIETLRK